MINVPNGAQQLAGDNQRKRQASVQAHDDFIVVGAGAAGSVLAAELSASHAPMGGVRDSGWGPTGPRSLDDFSDVIWINSHSGQRQYPF